ncbi:IclR family transcriptional regulator [Actinomadura roseirufa]|uniref:IclR family transcriptional regulator n=1 Tax=Actinomadura roseirufa TaxID=2094049 RepID=UPI0013F15121|nr:IclR family transcriptional regulator [Actinomadura roseirufa]
MSTPRVRLIQSTLRCLEVLDALAATEEPVSVSELARRMDARRGTLHQQLQTLVHAGWARQTPDAKYYLSLRALHVGKAALTQAGLAERLLPSLEELAERTGEAAALAVLDGTDVLIVQRVESPHLIRADIRVGTRMPLATSAAGLVLLAHADDARRAGLAGRGVAVPAPEVLDGIRERGYAVQKGEYQPGLSSAAVPVTLGPDEELLTLSMAAPTERFDEARAVTLLLEAQQEFYRG